MQFGRLTVQGALDSLQSVKPMRRGDFTTRDLRWMGWLALGVALAGCAGVRVDSAPEEKQRFVAQRAEARWQLLIKGDMAGAYEVPSAGSKATIALNTD